MAATGLWRIAKDAPAVGADGGEDGRGRLVGVILKDYQLGEAEIAHALSPECPADGSAASHYSVDLTFRYLPDLLKLAHAPRNILNSLLMVLNERVLRRGRETRHCRC